MININYRDSRPIYEQIKDGLKHLMINNVIKKDEKIPSVRDLASQMSINPNTIQRAYRDLEAEGYIYSIPGRGSFSSGMAELDDKKKKEIFDKFDDILRQLIHMGVSTDEIIETIQNRCKELYSGNREED